MTAEEYPMEPLLPDMSVRLTVPVHCRMRGVFTDELNVQITIGTHADGLKLRFSRFSRFSLQQLSRLALELLAVPYSDEPLKRPVKIVKPSGSKPPNLELGEDSFFVEGLRHIEKQLGPYIDWLLHLDDPDTEPIEFEDQILLSAIMSALGDCMRELAYSRQDWDNPAEVERALNVLGDVKQQLRHKNGAPRIRSEFGRHWSHQQRGHEGTATVE